jgi:hypothetical protein
MDTRVWEGTGQWRKMDNNVHNLYDSRDSVGVTKPGKMMWTRYGVQMVAIRHAYKTIIGEGEG